MLKAMLARSCIEEFVEAGRLYIPIGVLQEVFARP